MDMYFRARKVEFLRYFSKQSGDFFVKTKGVNETQNKNSQLATREKPKRLASSCTYSLADDKLPEWKT